MKNLTLKEIEYMYTNLLAEKLDIDNTEDWEKLNNKVKQFTKNQLKIQSVNINMDFIDKCELCA